ncbi:MAG: hypothetical protein AAFN92_14940, partial [Bacteroidota bacterium]
QTDYSILRLFYYIFRTAYLSLLLCLLVHVVLRGVWIAAVGLRSISGDIDYEQLRFQDRFTNRLRRRLGSFDDYIARLERNCSVIFSLAFLILFYFLSLVTWSMVAIVVQRIGFWLAGEAYYSTSLIGGPGISGLLLTVVSLLYFLDFVTLGLLKRSRWTARPYYYLYVFMGWVTLAHFYRPLYYNLIDNRFGRKLAVTLPFIVLLIMLGVSVIQVQYDYFPFRVGDGKVWLDANNYDDENGNRFDRMWRMSLASRYATNNYVEAFIPYRPSIHNDRLRRIDPDLEVSQYTGIKVRGAFRIGERNNLDADEARSLAAFAQAFQFYLNDSLVTNADPLFHFHPEREQAGVAYMIPVHELPYGRHALKVKSRIIEKDSLIWTGGRTIYFYK